MLWLSHQLVPAVSASALVTHASFVSLILSVHFSLAISSTARSQRSRKPRLWLKVSPVLQPRLSGRLVRRFEAGEGLIVVIDK